MNTFLAHGRIKAVEKKGGSYLYLLQFGKDKLDSKKPVQQIKKFIVRTPVEKIPDPSKFSVGDVVEVFGYVSGIVKRNMADETEFVFPEVVISNIQPAETLHDNNSEKFVNKVICLALVKYVQTSDNPKKPLTVYAQVGAKRAKPGEDDEPKFFRRTDTIPLFLFGPAKEHMLKANMAGKAVDHAFLLMGSVNGLLTKAPASNGIQFQSEMHPQVIISHIEPSISLPSAMLSPITQLDGVNADD